MEEIKMKKYGNLVISAILGSAITLAVFLAFVPFEKKTLKIEHISGIPSKNAVYTTNSEGDIIPLNFIEASKKVMDAVVNIRSTQTIKYAGSKGGNLLPDPFREFFGDDLYEHFYGPDFENRNPRSKELPPVRMGMGSGVIINKQGYIVTNNHVVADADDIEVTLHDNRTYKATVVGTDPATDLALISIEEKDLPTLPLVNSDDIEIGQWVLAVGNPFNLTSTVTAGIVSAKARNINILQDQNAIESFIQTDAAINPGNSGGALVDLQGGLVGINTAIASPTGTYSGYGFAVPSNIVSKVVEDLLQYGSVQRGYLGVIIRNINGDFAREKGLDITEGAYIDSVLTGSAAAKAGIREGDVVVQVDGKEIKQASELQELVARHRPGDNINVMVNRQGKTKEYKAVLQSIEGKTAALSKEKGELKSMLGADFKEIDKSTARKLDIKGGVRITKLHAGRLSRQTNIREGFIITKINDKPVESVEDLLSALQNRKGGVMLEGVYEDVPGVYYYAFGI